MKAPVALEVSWICMQEKQSLHPSRQPSWEHQGWRNLRVNATAIDASTPVGVGEIADVEDMEGIRVVVGEANRPLIHYLVKWKVLIPLC